MQYKDTLAAIQAQLVETGKLIEGCKTSNELHRIDLDLAMEKLRNSYDLLFGIAQEVSSMEPKIANEKKVVPKQEKVKELADEIKQELIQEDVGKEEPVHAAKTDTLSEKEVTSLGEKLIKNEPTLNEELSRNEQKISALNRKPVTSLTSAIGLNEKFELINNLFEGNADAFNHTMEVLNMATNFNEAHAYIQESFKWDMEDPYVQRILDLIRRKLIIRKNEQ